MTVIQVFYKDSETELFRFLSADAAEKFLISIRKNPDVLRVQKA